MPQRTPPEPFDPASIVLTRCWPASGRARTHVGLGVPRNALLAGLGLPVLALVALPLLAGRNQPLLLLAVVVVCIVPSRTMVKARRFYTIDNEAIPVHMIGPEQPERVRGKRGMSRRRFLAQVGSSGGAAHGR